MNIVQEESFEAFLKEHERCIYYYIHKLNIMDPHQEFYQEGLCALWDAYQTYQPDKAQLSTYLHNLIRNRFIDLIRKKKCQQRYEAMFCQEEITKQESGNRCSNVRMPVQEELLITVTNTKLWDHVKTLLTVNQWKWVKYAILLGLSNQQIAEKEKVSVAAVYSWEKMSKRKLKKGWKGWNRYVWMMN